MFKNILNDVMVLNDDLCNSHLPVTGEIYVLLLVPEEAKLIKCCLEASTCI